jgi:hypothetical protein
MPSSRALDSSVSFESEYEYTFAFSEAVPAFNASNSGLASMHPESSQRGWFCKPHATGAGGHGDGLTASLAARTLASSRKWDANRRQRDVRRPLQRR